MSEYQLGVVEARFADLVWAHAPLTTNDLVALCEQELSWKKSTTYTVLRRLCEKGMFDYKGGTVTVVLTREEFYARQSEAYVERSFHGSLPAFLAAFTSRKALTQEEVEELRRLVAEHEGEQA